MGVTTFTDEATSPIAPARLFKAFVLDAHILAPKLFPDAVASVEVTKGEGGAATVVQINLPDGKFAKHRFDVVDKENFFCKYTLIEGEELKDGVESIVYENKFEASSDGGSLCKRTVEVHSTREITEEDFKASREKAGKLFKGIEAYLLENPDA